MEIKSARPSVIRRVIILPILIIAFLIISHASTDYSPFLVHLHNTLTEFSARGQLTLELFAPLSATLGPSQPTLKLLTGTCHFLWALIAVQFFRVSKAVGDLTAGSHYKKSVLYCVIVGTVATFWSNLFRPQHLLGLLNNLADGCLILAIVTSITWHKYPRWLQALFSLGLGEALVLISYLLGCNDLDAVISYLLWTAARVRKIAGKITDLRNSPIRLALESSANIATAFIVCPILAMLMVGSLIPMSESAAGGNYNLSYLSASMRRHLTPFPVLDRVAMLGVTGSGLTDLNAYTIYLPRSGFLWSDSMIWQQSLPDQIPNSDKDHVDEDGKHWSVEGSRRVFFQDRFLARHPWEVQKYPRPRQTTQGSKRVLAGDTIRLHDPIASQYLCAIPGKRVVSEAGYFGTDNSTGQDLDRIRIGTVPNTGSANCDWIVYYDAVQGSVSFYNPTLKCDLASTFRSLPHSEPTRSNDTVLRLLDLRLEASCTVGASESSSRLYTIESFTNHQSHKALQKGLSEKQPSINNVSAFQRAIEYLLARQRLTRFRNYHSQLQEEAIGTEINEVQGMSRPFDLSRPEIAIFSFYLVAVVLAGVAKRTLSDEANGSLRNGIWRGCQSGGVFVLCHFLGYYVVGIRMLHSSRVAGLISLYCLAECFL